MPQSDRKITEIVLSGGPCSGKSTSLASLAAKLVEWDRRPLIVPELPTVLISGGLGDIGAIAGRDHEHFLEIEKQMLVMMRAIRLQYRALAETFVRRGESVVIVYDRAEADVAAYVGPETFQRLCQEAGLSLDDVRDSYDGVIYLVTAAFGAEDAYTTSNNAARLETIEQARELDLRTRMAWQGHRDLRVVDCSTDFQAKIDCVIDAAAGILGIVEPLAVHRTPAVDAVS